LPGSSRQAQRELQRRVGVEIHGSPEQLFLGPEAMEDGAFGDAGARRHLRGGRANAQLEEDLASDLEQSLGRNHRGPAA
jgi:hypothetical protein